MDLLELLGQLGQAEPADQAVLDAALQKLAESVGQDARHVRLSRLSIRRHGRMITATAAAALTAAAAFVVVGGHHRSAPVTRADGAPPAGQVRSGAAPAVSTGPAGAMPPGSPTVAGVLTAFNASRNDILRVTKTMRGDSGTLGKTVIWVSPVTAVPGTTVRSRILLFNLAGSREEDAALTYAAPAAAPATASSGCAIFGRPRADAPPAAGLPGTLTSVSYSAHSWGKAAVAVQAATVPSASTLRACLAAGLWHVSGHGMLAGVRVIEFVTSDGYQQLWVSAATFLPIRIISNAPDADTITFAFKFLQPTLTNQAMLTVPIPAGFAKIDF